MSQWPRVSVVVVGFNSKQFLFECFESLRCQIYAGDVELIYVDNASIDGSLCLMRESFPNVISLDAGENLEYGRGNNFGAARASGQVLVFLNPDTVVAPNWLQELVRPLVEDNGIGVTTSKIVLRDRPNIVNTFGGDLSLLGVSTCRYAGTLASEINSDEDVPGVSGAAFAIRSGLFARIGGFDPLFWMYLEDTDLAWRARLAGYRCVAVCGSVVLHHYSFSMSPTKTRWLEANRYMMLTKNLALRSIIALLPLLLVGELMTWCWAVLHGPRYIWAKLGAVSWCIANRRAVLDARRRTQQIRSVSDREILGLHLSSPRIRVVDNGLIGYLAAAFLTPLFIILSWFSLTLVQQMDRAFRLRREPVDELGVYPGTQGHD